MKKKASTIIIVILTLILAGVAIFTAIKLYQTGSAPVAPNVPSSEPEAYGGSCNLSFTLTTAATTTPTATPTKTATATPTPIPECNDVCTTNDECSTTLTCYIPTGSTSGNCRNNLCKTSTSCVCPTATPTVTPTATSTATATATATPTTPPGELNSCNGTCGSNSNCEEGLFCYSGYCRNSSCPTETDCVCNGTAGPTITATPTAGGPTSTATSLAQAPTSESELPEAGTSWPTIFGTFFGILVILGSILLVL